MTSELYYSTLLDTLPRHQYSPLTFIGSNEELDNIHQKIACLSIEKDFKINDLTERNTVKIIMLNNENGELLENPDTIYESVCKWIKNEIAIVALVESKCFNSIIEERLRARLLSGVVCSIK